MERERALTVENRRPKTFGELLDRYRRGERDFTSSEFDGDHENDLGGSCLDGVDLSGAVVVASFRGASLRDARFVGANLKTCDFREADLRGADFTGAALCATQFDGARLEGARFAGAYYHSHTLKTDDRPDW